eukprot:Hpha_TRINITY_DN30742_c0_g1::TRINITY_DN30742_c0_g1_i1::g.28395::m.28395/K20298/VPS52; vacuolar protein sorting-associated protein 52
MGSWEGDGQEPDWLPAASAELLSLQGSDLSLEIPPEVSALLEQGSDPRELREVAARAASDLAEVQAGTIQQTASRSAQIAELHSLLGESDGILKGLESCFSAFCERLDSTAETIERMQDEMAALQVKLKHRRSIESSLGALLEATLIPPDAVEEAASGDLGALSTPAAGAEGVLKIAPLLERLTSAHMALRQVPPSRSPKGAPAGGVDGGFAKEVEPCLTALTILLCTRARGFLLEKIGLLRKPMTNIPIVQQHVLLRYRPLMVFLIRHSPRAGQEVKDTYIRALSAIYFKQSQGFLAKLLKLERKHLDRKDLVTGISRGEPRDDPAFSLSPASRGGGDVLEDWRAPIVVPHVDTRTGKKHLFENLFRSMNLMLIDAVTSEYIFTFDFFADRHLHLHVFPKVLAAFRDAVRTWAPTCEDYYTLLCCVRLAHQLRLLARERRVPCLDAYFDDLALACAPQLQAMLTAQQCALAGTTPASLRTKEPRLLPMAARTAELTGNAQCILSPLFETSSANMPWLKEVSVSLITMTAELRRLLHGAAQGMSPTAGRLLCTVNLNHLVLRWKTRGVPDSNPEMRRVGGWLQEEKDALMRTIFAEYLPSMVDMVIEAEAALRKVISEED